MSAKHTPTALVICDLRAEWNSRPYVTFWRPENAGYAYPLAWAGDYTEAKILDGGSYYTAIEGGKLARFAVERSVVEAMAVAPSAGVIDGNAGPVVRNTTAIRRKLRKFAYAPPLPLPVSRHDARPRIHHPRCNGSHRPSCADWVGWRAGTVSAPGQIPGIIGGSVFGLCFVGCLSLAFVAGSKSEQWRIDHYTKMSASYSRSADSTDKLIETLRDFSNKRCTVGQP